MIQHLLQTYLTQVLIFVLVLTRLSGLVMTAPIFGSRIVPVKIRAFLTIGLALIISPLHFEVAIEVPSSLVGLAVVMGYELLLGLAIGLAVMILFAGLQLAGQIIGQISGMSLADVYDPTFEASVPVFSQLMDVVTLSVFVALGGHRQVLAALLDSFRSRPPGERVFPAELVHRLSSVVAESFEVGIRAAAPMMVALLLSVLILGLISRTLPQLNVLAVGFSVNAMIMLLTMALSFGSIAWVIQSRAESVIEDMRRAVRGEVKVDDRYQPPVISNQ